MLERVGNRVVVNPDPRLRRAAKRRGLAGPGLARASPTCDDGAPAHERLFRTVVHAGRPAAARSGARRGRRPRRRHAARRSSTETQEAEADIIARERAVVCGLGIVEAVFTRFDWRTRVRMRVARRRSDRARRRGGGGARAGGGAPRRRTHGAELPAAPVGDRDPDPGVRRRRRGGQGPGRPTRARPTPGLRALEKYAVRVGGGSNHRSDLASGILIKDNHVALVGSVREAVRRARANAPHSLRIEVEVDDAGPARRGASRPGPRGSCSTTSRPATWPTAVERVRERRPAT